MSGLSIDWQVTSVHSDGKIPTASLRVRDRNPARSRLVTGRSDEAGEGGGDVRDQIRRLVLDESGDLIDWQIAEEQDRGTTLGLCLEVGGRCLL